MNSVDNNKRSHTFADMKKINIIAGTALLITAMSRELSYSANAEAMNIMSAPAFIFLRYLIWASMLLPVIFFMKKIFDTKFFSRVKNMNIAGILILFFVINVFFAGGCRVAESCCNAKQEKIRFFFNWASPLNEEEAQKFADIGVTDVFVTNKKQHDLAKKYGMRSYWRIFTPTGPHPQVMSPAEEKHYAYINGLDLDKKLPSAERMKILHKRRIEKKHRYGGEMVTEIDTLNYSKVACFTSDTDLTLTRKKIDILLKQAPEDAAGTCIDYVGYTNHNGCYCDRCLTALRAYLSEHGLEDSHENRAVFYRNKLVEYYNGVIDYIKSKRPDFKIVVHLYPDFKPDPLFGNRIKADYCGQTVAWYFKWDEEKIKKYTSVTVNHAKKYHSFAEGIPFLGLNTNKTSSLGYKTPDDVERELKAILCAGGRSLMVCCGRVIIENGYYEVFKKYCGKK